MSPDPVDGFFSSMMSGVVRTVVGLFAMFAGFALCFLSAGLDIAVLWAWIILGIGLFFWWGAFGGWVFIGPLSFVLMFAFLWTFVQDRHAKFSFFATFSAAALYYSPITFGEGRWVCALSIYGVVACCYWVVPSGIARVVSRIASRRTTI